MANASGKRASSSIAAEEVRKFYNNPLLSDITICFGDQRIHAHKTILSMRSGYFRRAFAGGFKEATDSKMWLYEDRPDSIIAMLQFIYDIELEPDEWAYDLDLELFAVAGKYDVPELDGWASEGVFGILDQEIQEDSRKSDDLVVELVHRVYKEVPRHDGALIGSVEGFAEVYSKELLEREKTRKMLMDIPELSVKLLDAFQLEKTKREEQENAARARTFAEFFSDSDLAEE